MCNTYSGSVSLDIKVPVIIISNCFQIFLLNITFSHILPTKMLNHFAQWFSFPSSSFCLFKTVIYCVDPQSILHVHFYQCIYRLLHILYVHALLQLKLKPPLHSTMTTCTCKWVWISSKTCQVPTTWTVASVLHSFLSDVFPWISWAR